MLHALWVLSKYLLCKPRSKMYLPRQSLTEGHICYFWGLAQLLRGSVHTASAPWNSGKKKQLQALGDLGSGLSITPSCWINWGNLLPPLDPFTLRSILWLEEGISIVFWSANDSHETKRCNLAVSFFFGLFYCVNSSLYFFPAQASLSLFFFFNSL